MKVTGEMILQAIQDKEARDEERFRSLESKVDVKLHAIERVVDERLGNQRDRIRELMQKVNELSEHVGFIKALCAFAKIFKGAK